MKLAVIGDPVAHSLSPKLFAGFFAEHHITGTYEAIRVPQGETAAALRRLMNEDYTGVNVTTPLKEEAFAAADQADEAATFVRAANMVTFREGTIHVGNSDGIGGVVAIESALRAPVHGVDVLILGVGPTGRALAYEALKHRARVFIWNRTAARAHSFVASLDGARVWTHQDRPEVIFSTLPPDAELSAEMIAALEAAAIVIDANYGPRATLGARLGREVIDGYPMLVAQAKVAFEMWSFDCAR